MNLIPSLPDRTRFRGLIGRRGYQGVDTLADLATDIRFEIDHIILCGTSDIVIFGWVLLHRSAIEGVRLCSGHLSTPIELDHAIRIERPDVATTVGIEMGIPDPTCGFIILVPNAFVPDAADTYIEVATVGGKIAYRRVKPIRCDPMLALRRLLEEVDVQFAALAPAFDHVLGPAVAALNRTRLARKPDILVSEFGPPPPAPRISIIVTLFGRLDFFEIQLALASAHRDALQATEFIYVLDEPGRRREAENLGDSVYQRFGVPFRLLCLAANQGYGPANNIGLDHARGEFVCFLNSDVFPGTQDWAVRLADRLAADPGLGAIGPLLLFEDGSVQHEGIGFQPLPRFDNWMFPIHHRKGWRPQPAHGVSRYASITGACLMMRTAHACGLSGFAEDYVIGDFEDVDLCLRIADQGLAVAVDSDVWLYHLERQSQIAPDQRWRMNLTLYNAWLFQNRWKNHPLVTPAQ